MGHSTTPAETQTTQAEKPPIQQILKTPPIHKLSRNDVIQKSVAAVVSIEIERINGVPSNSTNTPETSQTEAELRFGSGFFIDNNGYIITNEHVVRGVKQVVVRNQDGDEALGVVVGTDPATDVAVIQTNMPAPGIISLASTHEPKVGEPVFAIGSAFGLPQSVTYGIVSALHRSVSNPLQDFIQTDSAINSGNSGGPLINSEGELLGINTAIISVRGGNNGVGFAIPTKIVHNISQQLINFQDVQPGHLGIHVQTVSPAMASALGTGTVKQGVVVTQVLPDSLAANMKIQTKDIITHVNDQPVVSIAQMAVYIYSLRAGSDINITLIRDGKTLQRQSSIVKGESETVTQRGNIVQGVSLTEFRSLQTSGFIQQGLGVLDVTVGSAGWLAGLQAGDLITHVNGKAVIRLADARSIALNKPTLVEVLRRDTPIFLVFNPTKVSQ